MSATIGDVIRTYMTIREKKAFIVAQAKEQTDKLDAALEKIETFILSQANAQGVTSFKSEHGTAFVSTVDYANVENWDALLEHIRQTNQYELLNKAVNKTAVRGFLDQHKTVPPGVKYGTKIGINVRKPSNSAE